MFVLAAPAFSSEIAETKYRGTLGSMMQLMIGIGILFINVNCETDWRGEVVPALDNNMRCTSTIDYGIHVTNFEF